MKQGLVGLLLFGALTFISPQTSYGEIPIKPLTQPKKQVLSVPGDIQNLGFKYHSNSDSTLNLMNIVCLKNGWYTINKINSTLGSQYCFEYDYSNLDLEQPFPLEILDLIDKDKNRFLSDNEFYQTTRRLELKALKIAFPEEFEDVRLDSTNY